MSRKPIANIRDFAISLVVWIAGTLLAARLSDATSVGLRVLAVAVAIGSAVPWARLVIGGIRQADEFSRQIHGLALGIGFGGVAVTVMAIDWMQRAHFIGPIQIGGIGLLVVWLWWGIGMVVASKHYR